MFIELSVATSKGSGLNFKGPDDEVESPLKRMLFTRPRKNKAVVIN